MGRECIVGGDCKRDEGVEGLGAYGLPLMERCLAVVLVSVLSTVEVIWF